MMRRAVLRDFAMVLACLSFLSVHSPLLAASLIEAEPSTTLIREIVNVDAGNAPSFKFPSAQGMTLVQLSSGPLSGLNAQGTGSTMNSGVAAATSGATASPFLGTQDLQVPLFQFAMFYGKGVDLEIAPGPPMTITGWVHSNSNLYLGPGSTLSFNSYITTSGSVYRKLKRDPTWP